ncbi:hypothetical protein KQI86_05170 [Clostridium sp. MSJ-11]|uniref:Uncharacterized protein n=1 Tax=Clostridium mobile TaxID=2841512 RepID=A0ABS6EG28_9CLOT|nr:hypothetical protein [Clostridium mobile]MBU5483712.1 hypothetical protein [Clostridium mobile]
MYLSLSSWSPMASMSNYNRTTTGSTIKIGAKDNNSKQNKTSINNPLSNNFNQNMGKKNQNTMIKSLMEQKQNLMERKNNYLSDALKKGASSSAIESGLEEIDKQIREIEEQIGKIKLEEKRKSLGADKESKIDKEDKNNVKNKKENSGEENSNKKDPLLSNTMKAVINSKNDIKNFSSVRAAQITLRRESKFWEHSDPVRSEELKIKSEALDGKIIDISNNVNNRISKAIKKDKDSESNLKISTEDTKENNKQVNSYEESQLNVKKIKVYDDIVKGEVFSTGASVNTIA